MPIGLAAGGREVRSWRSAGTSRLAPEMAALQEGTAGRRVGRRPHRLTSMHLGTGMATTGSDRIGNSA